MIKIYEGEEMRKKNVIPENNHLTDMAMPVSSVAMKVVLRRCRR